MNNYMTKAAAHARLIKLARAAHYIRRQRELQKYAQAVQMQKYALSDAAVAGIGAGAGGLLGGGLGYILGGKDKKLLSTLIGAGAGAGIGGLGGYGLNKIIPRSPLEKAIAQWEAQKTPYSDLPKGSSLRTTDGAVLLNGKVVGHYDGNNKFTPVGKQGPAGPIVPPKKPTAANVQNNDGYPIVLPYGTMS